MNGARIWIGGVVGLCLITLSCTFGGTTEGEPGGGAGSPDGSTNPLPNADASEPGSPDADRSVNASPGDACGCDADCPAVGSHEGVCVFGVCMTRASETCSAGGSTAECGAGSQCWGLEGVEGSICWPDCASYDCAGQCDGDGSCAPTATNECTYSCSDYCACEPDDCQSGESCVSGSCIANVSGNAPGVGPGPTCANLPQRDCTGSAAFCGQLVQMNPSTTAHYDDYPINGETSNNQYRSWIRRDFSMLLDYATAKTLCKTASWDTGIGGALGFGDMSESNGAIPGTSVGQPGHPANTHTNGSDIDIAYYQAGQPNNQLRPICNHVLSNQDQYHCVSTPTSLDIWRHAFFLGTIFESSRVRVIGVDGQAGQLFTSAFADLCAAGWLSGSSCGSVPLAYEVTNMGQGWFQFHHHHSHISLNTSTIAPVGKGGMQCRVPGCPDLKRKPSPLRLAK
jgi:hypothetical protein